MTRRGKYGFYKNRQTYFEDKNFLAKAIELKEEGASYANVAKQLAVPTSLLKALLFEAGYRRRLGPCFSSPCLPDSSRIVEMYLEGKSSTHIAAALGYKPLAVTVLLREMGRIRNTKPYQSTIDHSWLDVIDSEIKAYFLGILCADGWINRNTVFLSLKTSDGALVRRLASLLPGVPDPREYPPGKMNVEGSVRLAVTSGQWRQSLLQLGVTTAKSLTLDDVASRIPDSFRHHFVRGYFDGDGSIYHSVYRGKRRVCVSFRGTLEFLRGLHSAIGLPVGGIYPKARPGIKTLSYCGKTRMYQIRDYLYRDASIFLERKHERFAW